VLAARFEASAFKAESGFIKLATSEIWIPNLKVFSDSCDIERASSSALVPGPSIVKISSS
jgi:hypothetical protein